MGIKARANLYNQIRSFFSKKTVLEIETPLLSLSTIPDPNIHSLTTTLFDQQYYLQTSPEFAMKRLLAAGSGDIFQICKAFRNDEVGSQHNPEFTLLEWYRLGFDHHQLMAEIDELLQVILKTSPANYITYQQLFIKYLDIDPLRANEKSLKGHIKALNINFDNLEALDKDNCLHLLMSHSIEPLLKELKEPLFVYDFPLSQGALAKQSITNPLVAERFEVYVKGVELANGFHELTDAKEQRARFIADNKKRQQENLPVIPLDENFLKALESLPACAGVALGLDRLLMLLLKEDDIRNLLSFPMVQL